MRLCDGYKIIILGRWRTIFGSLVADWQDKAEAVWMPTVCVTGCTGFVAYANYGSGIAIQGVFELSWLSAGVMSHFL